MKDGTLFFGLMAALFIAAAYGLVVITTIMAIFALAVAGHTITTFFRLNHRARILPRDRIHRILREQHIIRPLANHLLRAAGVPTKIPAGAMNALLLGDCNHVKDGSPLDWPVFWSQGESRVDDDWFWRRTNKPIAAVQLPDGTWETQPASS